MKSETLVIISFVSCEKIFFNEDVSNTQENNFEMFWNDFNIYYPFFEIKNINWDSIYTYYKPMVTNHTSNRELFDVFSEMIRPLKYGHVQLYSQYGIAHSYPMEIFTDYYSDSRLNLPNCLDSYKTNNSNINYWNVINHNICIH